jgi:hypothetical protein
MIHFFLAGDTNKQTRLTADDPSQASRQSCGCPIGYVSIDQEGRQVKRNDAVLVMITRAAS